METEASGVKGDVTSRTLRNRSFAASEKSLRGLDELWCELGGGAI